MTPNERTGRALALFDDLRRVVVAHTDSLAGDSKWEVALDGCGALLAYVFAKSVLHLRHTRNGTALFETMREMIKIQAVPNLWDLSCAYAADRLRSEGLIEP